MLLTASAKKALQRAVFRHRLTGTPTRRGSKTILIPIVELERWLEKSPARYPI